MIKESKNLTKSEKKQKKLESLRKEIETQAVKVRDMRNKCEGAWRNNVRTTIQRKLPSE